MMYCTAGFFTTLEDVRDPKRKSPINQKRFPVPVCTSQKCSGFNAKGVIKDVKINTDNCPDCNHPIIIKRITDRDVTTFYYKGTSYATKKLLATV